MAEIHRDKNGNPMKGAAEVSHIIHTHDGGLEAHDAAIFQKGVQFGYQKANRERINTRRIIRKKHQGRTFLDRLLKR